MFRLNLIPVMSVCVCSEISTENWYEPIKYCMFMYVNNNLCKCCAVNVGMFLLCEKH